MPPGASPGSAISLCRIGKRSDRPIRYRLKKKFKRRTDVVGVFPTPAALLRLAGSLLVEAHDEWQVAEKRYLSEYHIQDALWLIGRKRSAGVFGAPLVLASSPPPPPSPLPRAVQRLWQGILA